MMMNGKWMLGQTLFRATMLVVMPLAPMAGPAAAQQAAPRDPAEPAQGKPQPKILPRPGGRGTRQAGDGKSMRKLIAGLVGGRTGPPLSSVPGAKPGAGAGRGPIVCRFY